MKYVIKTETGTFVKSAKWDCHKIEEAKKFNNLASAIEFCQEYGVYNYEIIIIEEKDKSK